MTLSAPANIRTVLMLCWYIANARRGGGRS